MKIAFLDTVHPLISAQFKQAGWQIDELYSLNREELKTVMAKYDGLVLRSRIKINSDFLSHCTQLKFIGRPGAGLENIDLDYCEQHGVRVYRSPEGNRDAVAEHALGMLLMLFNHLKRADFEVRNGQWNREGNRGIELKGKTVGLIGYGFMGEALAKRLQGFDVKVIAYDKYKSNFSSALVQEVSLEELFERTEVLSLHTPETTETIGMISADFLANFKHPIFLINTARGKAVILKDLLSQIESGKVLGACLDVLENEKSSFENVLDQHQNEDFQKLIENEKVLLSPHIAGWTVESKEKMATYLSEKILADFSM